MANEAKLSAELAMPVLEHLKDFTHATIAAKATSAITVPATSDVLANRKGIIIQNKSSTHVVYLGDSTVTADSDDTVTGGYELGPKDAIWIPLDGSKTIYLISDTASTGIMNWQFI